MPHARIDAFLAELLLPSTGLHGLRAGSVREQACHAILVPAYDKQQERGIQQIPPDCSAVLRSFPLPSGLRPHGVACPSALPTRVLNGLHLAETQGVHDAAEVGQEIQPAFEPSVDQDHN